MNYTVQYFPKGAMMQASNQKRIHQRFQALGMAAGLVLLTSSCALVPNLGPKPEGKPPASYAAAKSFEAPSADWPAADWWTVYDDPQLNALVDEALKNSPDIALAAARVRTALGQAQEAGAALYPTLDASAEAGKTKQSYNMGVPPAFVPKGWIDNGKAALDFNWEIDFWGKNRAALAAATSEAEAARLDGEQAKLMLTTSLVSAYADLAQLYTDRDTAVEALKVRHGTTELFKERFANGLETQGGQRQSEANEASAEAELRALDENIGLARNGIATLMGAGPDRGLELKRPAARKFKGFGLPKTLQADLLGRRPDVAAARLRAAAAAQDIDVAKADFYPNINLAASFGFQSLGLHLLTDKASEFGSFGPAIHLPIFEGGRLRGQYKAARGEYDAAIAQYDGAVAKALEDVANVAVSERALTGRLEKTKDAVTAAEQAHKVALDRYQGGLSTYLEVLNAQDLLINNRRAYADLKSRVFTLDVALIKALGGGFTLPAKKDK